MKATFPLFLFALLLALLALAAPAPTRAAHSAASAAPAMCAKEFVSVRLSAAAPPSPGTPSRGTPSRFCNAEKRLMLKDCDKRLALGRELPKRCWTAKANYWQCQDEDGGGR